ncbi:MAG: hypothetical protein BroJett011_62280 [Chloroflexota bacterium]|nr:MAG: hypothetical protein BroJett011_62280 [Chloroflexota bacterium]
MTKKFISVYGKVIALVVIAVMAMGCSAFASSGNGVEKPLPAPQEQISEESVQAPAQKFKILHIMSYHSPWEWTDNQLNGFKAALKELDVEYKVIQMDTKGHSDEESKLKVAQEAKDLINTWQPDLVYTSDDDVQKYVVQDYLNKDIPFVFSGVNADPAQYNFVGVKNVTGVIEHQHFVESVDLLKKIAPDVKKIAVVIDDSPFWNGVTEQMKKEESQLPSDVKIVSWDMLKTYEEYQQKVKEYQSTVDAIALLGIFNFKDEQGKNVPYQEVQQWTAENSNLPDFSFWVDRVAYGTLSSVTVSAYEQGLAAGEMARGILVEGKSPADFPMKATVKGEPVISLVRAKNLGLNVDSEILLTARVINTYAWDEQK